MKCKYNIVRNGETKHLCDDECFKTFRARPTDFLQSSSARRAAEAAECDYCHSAVGREQCTHTIGKVSKTFCQMVGAVFTCISAFVHTCLQNIWPVTRFGWSIRRGAGNNVQDLFHSTLGLVRKVRI